MPKIYFIANKATQRCKEDLKNQQWRENEKEYFLFDLLRLFYDCLFVWRHV